MTPSPVPRTAIFQALRKVLGSWVSCRRHRAHFTHFFYFPGPCRWQVGGPSECSGLPENVPFPRPVGPSSLTLSLTVVSPAPRGCFLQPTVPEVRGPEETRVSSGDQSPGKRQGPDFWCCWLLNRPTRSPTGRLCLWLSSNLGLGMPARKPTGGLQPPPLIWEALLPAEADLSSKRGPVFLEGPSVNQPPPLRFLWNLEIDPSGSAGQCNCPKAMPLSADPHSHPTPCP